MNEATKSNTNNVLKESELSRERELNQERLREFIQSKGGRITFSQFMWFNSFSEYGYYSQRVKIGQGSEFDFCTYASNPLLAQAYVGYAKDVLSHSGSVFLEIAGGEGTLKKNALDFLRAIGSPARFLSVELSSLLVKKQHAVDPFSVQATALQLPFQNTSLEGAIIANELPDALPLVVVSVRTKKNMGMGVLTGLEELYYKLAGDGTIQAEWSEISPSSRDALRIVEQAWEERGIFLDNFYDGQLVVFAPEAIELIKELIRVMESGHIILTDYGTQIDESVTDRGLPLYKRLRVRQFPSKREVPLEALHTRVFENDLTCDVDFTLLLYVARQLGATCKLYSQSDFCARFNPDELFESVESDKSDPRYEWFTSNNPIKSGEGWKALVISVEKHSEEAGAAKMPKSTRVLENILQAVRTRLVAD